MIIVNAAGSIWIDKDVEVDKDNCGTTPPSPFSSLLTSLHLNPVTITNVNPKSTSPSHNIMSSSYQF